MKRFLDLTTPIGPLRLVSDGSSLTELHLRPEPRQRLAADEWRESPGLRPLSVAVEQLAQYFAGQRRGFDLPLAPAGTPFQLQVWQALREIPYGQTWSYGQLATHIGSAGAARAVGLANNRNPIPIVIPCHRVIGADGSLVGFGGGLPMKQWLLHHEGAGAAAQGALALSPPQPVSRGRAARR